MLAFDPDAPAAPGSGIFGLPHSRAAAEVVLVPVPFDATTSYRPGAVDGPAAVLAASHQVDLFDAQTGRPYERGIHLLPEDPEIRAASVRARSLVERAVDSDMPEPSWLREIDRAGDLVNAKVAATVEEILAARAIPGVLGGDHSVPFAALATLARHHGELGVLHVDAHADLRDAYQGFRWSHASIMRNVLREIPEVIRLVQVGVRDLGSREMRAIEASGGRVITHLDMDWQRRLARGEHFAALCEAAMADLPQRVYVSFDIDGLDPALCPHTGTPVPGGLSFVQACLLLEALQRSGRTIVGFDLCEVAPGPDGDEWDAAVGARVLYKLCGFALLSRPPR
jgi:agmatinase